MLDPQALRNEMDRIAAALSDRGYELDVDAYAELEARRKASQQRLQELQGERNKSAKSIGQAKASGEDIQPLLDEVSRLGEDGRCQGWDVVWRLGSQAGLPFGLHMQEGSWLCE